MTPFCRSCGHPTDPGASFCPTCGERQPGAPAAAARPIATRAGRGSTDDGGAPYLVAIGILCLAGGLYFLLFPGSPVDTSALGTLGALAPTEVVNLQKLAIGMTASVVGAIFLAAGLAR